MDLWIKNKEKTRLCKANFIEIDNLEYNNGEINIVVNDHYFGRYTKERAMEIIDEIGHLLNPQIYVKTGEILGKNLDGTLYKTPDEIDFNELSTCFYQMPEK